MNSFFGFLKKEFFHIFRDRRTMLILFGLPVVQLLLFGYAIRNEIEEVKIAILDRSNDYVSQEIINKLLSTGYFVPIKNLTTNDEIDAAFRSGHINEVIVFEANFAHNLFKEGRATIQIITDGSDPNVSRVVEGYTKTVIQDYQESLSENSGQMLRIEPELKMMFNPELKSVYLFVPGLMALILMLVSALMTSITITREKEFGTMEILLVSPLKPYQIILGKTIPYLILSFINVLTIIILAQFIFGVPCNGSILLLLAESLLYIVTALSLGIMISTIADSQQTAMMISLAGLLLPTVMLSGFIFPITSMPMPLQIISNIMPAKWYLIIVRSIMLKGVGIEAFWQETLVLASMTLILMIVSVKKFKIRLQ
ncbi:ABC-2 type transporter [Chloroherpeton thalassium ATCC 35110]|uniref:Transport permease protein n=1 Tax=Chloroherpeton thalassium (strain ATCC 35110 / GB-78) TaxID=517418 RepID=B3QZ83_CHLT3|nr:ABC transporter permease [Chloroherpeton thalassium]ACF13776.1 ABC-2 type transporter [Chloroherpeton thalassium ATCC 35110]